MNDWYKFVSERYPEQYERMLKHGRRNVSFSTVAPTGTTSLMTQTTSGIEPLFMPYYIRRKKGNPGDKDFRVDFTDQNGDNWMEYPVLHPKFKKWMNFCLIKDGESPEDNFDDWTKEQIQECFEDSPWYGSTANDINWIRRVEMQNIVQKYTTHSISSTINLPNSVTKEEVSEIYLTAWEKGLKGVTVYRDGCRTGVLVADTDNKTNDTFSDNNAPKRPDKLECHVYHATTHGERFTMIIGLMDDRPYEAFIIPGHRGRQTKEAFLHKVSQGEYDLLIQNGSEKIYTDMTETMTDEQVMVSRLLSWGLRHGGSVKYAVEQLLKCPSDHMFSFNRVITRILKNYIKDGETSTATCLECTGKNVVYQEGCQICMDCGSSKCG